MEKYDLENYTPKGELQGFPKEVIAHMLECQVEQGCSRDISTFERSIITEKGIKRFSWRLTKEGYDFWYEVIVKKYFYVFFKKYPKKG